MHYLSSILKVAGEEAFECWELKIRVVKKTALERVCVLEDQID